MTNIQEISQSQVIEHEKSINANVCLGGYHMDDYCPRGEVKCYRAILEESDTPRVYLLKEGTFREFTPTGTYKVTEILPNAGEVPRVKSFMGNIDLRTREDLLPIIVGADLQVGALTVIDGNHRITAHYLGNGSLAGISVYVYIHPNMNEWNFRVWGFLQPAL